MRTSHRLAVAAAITATAALATIALHLFRELDATRHALHTDDLTGLPNRRALMSDLTAVLSARHPVTLAIFDLDGFKSVNDNHGHEA
ncbi:diguanylate cyclase, partial [Polymorphospora sp. NPDC050346]|uniref:diguanylate cyclase domain-containing protein n=1 Tax=Polymorphospora sp. NPDC050346 TaxID=3155780 RepID=UPI0033F08D68